MPIASDKVGFLCPVVGCGGFAHTEDGSHNKYGTSSPWARKIKVCRDCGCRFGTLEQVTWVQPPLFTIDRQSGLIQSQN